MLPSPSLPLCYCFFSFPKETEVSSLGHFSLWTFLSSVDCILGTLYFYFLANIHLLVSTYHVCHFGPELPHSGWYFLVPFISCKTQDILILYSWVVFHCVNEPYFLYPFFCHGTSWLFPASGYNKQGHYEHNGKHALVTLWGNFWIYSQEWYY